MSSLDKDIKSHGFEEGDKKKTPKQFADLCCKIKGLFDFVLAE